MKVTIEFDPVENKFELEAAMKATDMWLVLKGMLTSLNKGIEVLEDLDSDEKFGGAIGALKNTKEELLREIENNGLDNLIFNY